MGLGPRWIVSDLPSLVGLVHPQKSPGPLLPAWGTTEAEVVHKQEGALVLYP